MPPRARRRPGRSAPCPWRWRRWRPAARPARRGSSRRAPARRWPHSPRPRRARWPPSPPSWRARSADRTGCLPSAGRPAPGSPSRACRAGRARRRAARCAPARELSATALSGRPTMTKACRPGVMRTCTSTGRASMPTNASVEICPYMLVEARPTGRNGLCNPSVRRSVQQEHCGNGRRGGARPARDARRASATRKDART